MISWSGNYNEGEVSYVYFDVFKRALVVEPGVDTRGAERPSPFPTADPKEPRIYDC